MKIEIRYLVEKARNLNTYPFSPCDQVEELTPCSVLKHHENLSLSINKLE